MTHRHPRSRLLVPALLCAALSLPAADAVPGVLAYQGRIAVSGTPFSGSGRFKFALVNAAGSTSYWSNDGSSVGGGEPGTAVTVAVAEGLYTVLLGDATLSHMTAVPAGVGHRPAKQAKGPMAIVAQ